MKKFVNFLAASILLISSLVAIPVFAASPADSTLAPMLQKVLPAVVNIRAQIKVTDFNTLRELQKQRGMKPQNDDDMGGNLPATFLSVGSGVIVDAKNGYVLTNAHVVNEAQTVTVTLSDAHHYTAKIIGLDKPSDIALLQIKATNLTAIPVGDSNKLKVGDFVAAIGNPFGLNQTVTSGIVSALGRTTLGIENYENFIQTDAPINPGNSGGALISMKGELIGINTAILAPDRGSIGIGFAIPSSMAQSVMQQWIQYGNIQRGALGIGAQDITPDLAAAFNMNSTKGAAIAQVLPGSPGQKAGLQEGDIITSINGTEMKNGNDVVNTVAFMRVDSKLDISILRNHKPMLIKATLIDPKKRKELLEQSDPFLYGVGLKDFSLLSPMYGEVKGVLIVGVERDTNAWRSDLRPGDVVTSINQKKVSSTEELKSLVAKADKTVLMHVLRGPLGAFLVINKET